jgi:hypothetical protein
VNPTLTTVANALRVGDHLIDRLGAAAPAAANAAHPNDRSQHKAGESLA